MRPFTGFFPVLVILIFLGALFWAKSQDPFSRQWFTVFADGHSVKCVAVLPKPVRQYPVILYAHGSGGSLMNDGKELRQMAELGLAVVSFEYDQTNAAAFSSQFEALLRYVGRQKWADTNAVAWVGFSLGANRMMDLGESGKRKAESGKQIEPPHVVSYGSDFLKQPPQLLVLIGGAGLGELDLGKHSTFNIQHSTSNLAVPSGAALNSQLSTNLHCPTLLIHGERDEVFPVADTRRLAAVLQTNGVPVELKILPGLPHGLEPERGVVFRGIGEYCRELLLESSSRREEALTKNSELGTRNSAIAWQTYHSIAQWQAEVPALWWFWLPTATWAFGWLVWLRYDRSKLGSAPAPGTVFRALAENFGITKQPNDSSQLPTQEAGREARPTTPVTGVLPRPNRTGIALRWLAVLLATWALAESAIHLVTPQFSVNDTTLAIARRFLVPPKQRADFEYLAAQAIWGGNAHLFPSQIPSPQPSPRLGGERESRVVSGPNVQLKTLLEHVELAGYNRELINWQLDDKIYRDFVLSPVITDDSGVTSSPTPTPSPSKRVGDSESLGLLSPALSSFAGGEGAGRAQSKSAAVGSKDLPRDLDWRRSLWEEFYPRIRRESSPEDAARIVVRHLRERVTIAASPNLPHDVSDIWLRQITDAAGFEVIYVAALRSVGIPARLDSNRRAEFWNGNQWLTAPSPSVISW